MGATFYGDLYTHVRTVHFETKTRKKLNKHTNQVHNRRREKQIGVHGKQYKCEHCPFSSTHKRSLEAHILGIHDKVRRHFCGECNYAATHKANLMYHIDSVHNKGDKRFKCERCSYSSAWKGNLSQHMKTLHNSKTFKCDLCPYKSPLVPRAEFKRHIQIVHLKGIKNVCG